VAPVEQATEVETVGLRLGRLALSVFALSVQCFSTACLTEWELNGQPPPLHRTLTEAAPGTAAMLIAWIVVEVLAGANAHFIVGDGFRPGAVTL
jgi:hypothetical protein